MCSASAAQACHVAMNAMTACSVMLARWCLLLQSKPQFGFLYAVSCGAIANEEAVEAPADD